MKKILMIGILAGLAFLGGRVYTTLVNAGHGSGPGGSALSNCTPCDPLDASHFCVDYGECYGAADTDVCSGGYWHDTDNDRCCKNGTCWDNPDKAVPPYECAPCGGGGGASPAPTPTPWPPPCPYGSTQAQIQLNVADPWDDSESLVLGNSVNLGGFHNGTGYFAGDTVNNNYPENYANVDFYIDEPPAGGAELRRLPPYPIAYTPPVVGNYTFRGETRLIPGDPDGGYHTGAACRDTGSITVRPQAPIPTATAECTPTVQVRLTWGAVSGATEYHIERCTGAGCSVFSQIATDTASPYLDTTAVTGNTYRYRMRTHNHTYSLYSDYSTIVTATLSCVPATPTLTVTASCSPFRSTLSWTVVAGMYYHIERCTGAGCTTSFSAIATDVTTSPYYDTTVVNNNTYGYRMRAHNHANGLYSAYSTIRYASFSCTSTIQVRALELDRDSYSCPYDASEINQAIATSVTLTGLSTATGTTPSDETYIQFINMLINPPLPNYTVTYTLPIGYLFAQYCVADNLIPSSPWYPAFPTRALSSTGLSWDLGFTTPGGWLKVGGGGNVHTNGNIIVELPTGDYFLEGGTDRNAGIASYVGPIDAVFGDGDVSSEGFLVEETGAYSTISSYYDYYDVKYGQKTDLTSANGDPGGVGVYVYKWAGAGDMEVTGTWNLVSGQKVIIFVPENLKISTNISIPNGAFLAFIVKGSITIADTVGGDSSTFKDSVTDEFSVPHIAGIFITDATFTTESADTGTDLQLILAGTFVANNFSLGRDLDVANNDFPGEFFVFRSDLWINAPEGLKEIEVIWQEAAP